MARSDRYMKIASNGKRYYGRQGVSPSGHKGFVKAGNEIDYVFKKMEEAANLGSAAIYRELVKMSQAFFESYVSGSGGQKMPMDTGNLIDSSSILVARGKRSRKAIHVAQSIAVKPQHWGNWGTAQKGAGYGEDYRMTDIDDTMIVGENGESVDVAVSLRVGIPYAVPLNDLGSHGKHKAFFDDMADDFRNDVMDISKEVAARLSSVGDDSLIYEGVTEL